MAPIANRNSARNLQLSAGFLPCSSAQQCRIPSDVNPPPPPISRLEDDLLIEVLIRVPEPRSSRRCKPVCKRWSSLISSPHFNRRFVSHHRSRNEGGGEREPPLIPSYAPESILSFLPIPKEAAAPRYFTLFDSFKDLILCGFVPTDRTDPEFVRSLFVCNPFTKQWIALPLLPEKPIPEYNGLAAALVCQPRSRNSNCSLDLGDGQAAFVYSEHRFRVVCVYQSSTAVLTVKLDVFCSESGGWTKEALVLGGHQIWFRQNVVSTGDGLLWLCMHSKVPGDGGDDYDCIIAGFSPFRLDLPPIRFNASLIGSRRFNIAVSRGALHVILFEATTSPMAFCVWRRERKDLREPWSKQHEVFLNKTSSGNYELDDCYVVGMHPEKSEIIFLEHLGLGGWGPSILSFNLKTGEEELIVKSLPRWRGFLPRVSCWPTPIPRYEKLLGIYDGSYSCWVQSSEATTPFINN